MKDDCDAEALKAARGVVWPGERVLWAGRPTTSLWAWREVVFRGLMVVVAAALGVYLVDDAAQGALMPWWGWVIFPVMAMVTPLIWLVDAVLERRRAAVETYAVTDLRVLILSGGFVRMSVDLDRIDRFRLRGRTLWLHDGEGLVEAGRGRLDGGLSLLDTLPRLKRLRRPEQVWAVVQAAAETRGHGRRS
jgi:hypothetical protein